VAVFTFKLLFLKFLPEYIYMEVVLYPLIKLINKPWLMFLFVCPGY